MSASNSFENSLLLLLLQNTNIANLGDSTGVRGSSVAGNLYVSLHTGDPTEGGTQTSFEATYTGYARVAVPRSSAGWTVTNDTFQNAAAITFPACTGGANTISHFGIGVAATLAGQLMLSGSLTGTLAVSNGITPAFNAGALTGTAD